MSEIVVGVDGSPESRSALRWAIDYAQRMRTDLRVVSVVPLSVLTALWTDRPDENVKEAHTAATRAEVERMLQRHEVETEKPLACPVEVVVEAGHPVSVLCRLAADADLLVVGSRRPSLAGRFTMGSVSDAVAHHAQCPVAVIRRPP